MTENFSWWVLSVQKDYSAAEGVVETLDEEDVSDECLNEKVEVCLFLYGLLWNEHW